jgi:hypothetical protein
VQTTGVEVMAETAALSGAAVELASADPRDARLNRRLVRVAEQLGAARRQHSGGQRGLGGDRGAAYRLLAHENVIFKTGCRV